LRPAVLRRVPSRVVDIEAWEVNSDSKVWVPAWMFLPRKNDPSKPVLIVLEPNGRNGRWHEGELYQNLAAQGYPVCVPDLRGVGDLAPEFGRGAAGYERSHQDEENYTWASLILGKPLLGQRVTDVLAVLQALSNYPALAVRKLRIAAQGKMTVPAAFAAALTPRVESLYLAAGLISYRSLVDTEDYAYPFANFIPKLLEHTDLPEVIVGLAPRPVALAGTVDATGAQVETKRIGEIYRAVGNVRVLERADWSIEALVGV